MSPKSIHSILEFPLVRTLVLKTLTVLTIGLLVSLQSLGQCLEITTSPDSEIFCPGEEITLTATAGFENYNWYYNFSDENSGGTLYEETESNSLTLNASEWAVSYWYVETGDPECTDPSPTVVWDSWIFAPIAISHDENTMLCPGDSSLIENAFNGPSNFQWYKDFLPIPDANQAQYWVTEPGYYTLEASYPQCPDYFLSSGVGPEFNEYDVVLPEITAETMENEVILSIESGSNIQWYLDGEALEGANELTHTAVETGIYTVSIVDENGCNLESEGFILETLSGSFQEGESEINAFPNPFSDYLQISSSKSTRTISYNIYNVAGKSLKSGTLNPKSQNEIRDLGNLKPGVYVLELLRANQPSKRLKLVKR